MKEHNLILTDIMKTGDNVSYDNFIQKNTLKNQTFTNFCEYYTLHHYNLDKYTRKLALIHLSVDNIKFETNKNYDGDSFTNELNRRCNHLANKGFKFIFCLPWESKENYNESKINFFPKITVDGHFWFGGLSWFWFLLYEKFKNKNFNIDHKLKIYDFLYLNKVPRSHRIQLFEKLKKENLLSNSLCSFGDHPTNPFDLNKNYELPFLDKNKRYPHQGFDQEIFEKPYNDTFCSIVSETNVNDFDFFITEKLWKPIIMQHIFVVLGNCNLYKKIKELGFKTFSNIFDESFDDDKNVNNKINTIVKVLKKIKTMDYEKLYNKTKKIREHNYKNFFDDKNLSNVINDELLSWLEFVDNSQVSSTKS